MSLQIWGLVPTGALASCVKAGITTDTSFKDSYCDDSQTRHDAAVPFSAEFHAPNLGGPMCGPDADDIWGQSPGGIGPDRDAEMTLETTGSAAPHGVGAPAPTALFYTAAVDSLRSAARFILTTEHFVRASRFPNRTSSGVSGPSRFDALVHAASNDPRRNRSTTSVQERK